jgi:hypothetical protein
MQLKIHFLVILIKTPHHLVLELLPMVVGFTKDISALRKMTEQQSITQVRMSKP